MTTGTSRPALRRRGLGLALALTLTALAALLGAAVSQAEITTIGSPLTAVATLNTAQNLNYQGTDTPVPPNPEAPNGLFHTFHSGADTALWNVALKTGSPSAPANGQAVKIRLEGCAEEAPRGPAPLTQIHFQDITPLPGGGAKVNITSGAFDIPICGHGGATGGTISTYEPVNLCMKTGDYIDFNDEGGYVENVYRNGVPYRVLGAVAGSKADSFIRGGGTNNGAVMSSSDRTTMDGFAENENEELMLQVMFGTGADATHICAGGTSGLPPALAPMRISAQKDGVNHSRITRVAIFCRQKPQCKGIATLTYKGQTVGRSGFALSPNSTGHVSIRLSPKLFKVLRKRHRANVVLTAVLEGGQTFTQSIVVGIF
jgi:hypothetical protein